MATRQQAFTVYSVGYTWRSGTTYADDTLTLASLFGAIDAARHYPLAEISDLERRLREAGMLADATAGEDEPDDGAEDRDARQLAEAQARLAKLGGASVGSLCDAAADEVVRLREHITVLGKEEAHSDSLVSKLKVELQQAKAKAEELRGEVETLRREARDARDELAAKTGETLREAAKRVADALMRELAGGAAEMRERAAAWCDAEAKEKQKREQHLEASVLWHAYQEIRALPLSPEAPATYGDESPHLELRGGGPTCGAFAYGSRKPAAAHGEPGKGAGPEATAAGKDSVADDEAEAQATYATPGIVQTWNPRGMTSGTCRCPGVAAPEVGRPVGVCRTCGGWRPIAVGPESECAAEERQGGQEAPCSCTTPAPIVHAGPGDSRKWCWRCGGSKSGPMATAPAGLPKPQRVEVGQRWRFDARDMDGTLTDHTVDAAADHQARLVGNDGRTRYRLASELLTSLRWTFLGPAPAPQGPKGDGETEATPAQPAEAPDLSEPTARDAVAGMLARSGWTFVGEGLALSKYAPAEAAKRLQEMASPHEARERLAKRNACVAALEALARGDLRGARDHQDLMAAIERLTREVKNRSDEVVRWCERHNDMERQRDEALEEAADLRADLKRMTEREADLARQRDEACKDALDATRELRAMKAAASDTTPLQPAEDVAREMIGHTTWLGVACHATQDEANRARGELARLIDRSRAEGARMAGRDRVEAFIKTHGIDAGDTVRDERDDTPAMRIEKRADGEWLVGATDESEGCGALAPDCRLVCARHVDGTHVASGVPRGNGDRPVFARWPIAPAQDERRGTGDDEGCGGPVEACARPGCDECGAPDMIRIGDDEQVLFSKSRGVHLVIAKDADPRAVLATVAELLGLTERSVRSLFEANAYGQGVENGRADERAKVEATARELAERRSERMEVDRKADPQQQGARAWHRLQGSDDSIEQCRGELRHAFGITPPAPGGGTAPSEAEERARALDRDGFHGDARAVRAHELGVAEGERRAKAKAAELHERWRGLMDLDARDVDHDDAGAAANARGWVRCRGVCMRDLRARFDLPDTDPGQPPTGGEPGPEEPSALDRRMGDLIVNIQPSTQTPADADERWQPGAVWEKKTRGAREQYEIEYTSIDLGSAAVFAHFGDYEDPGRDPVAGVPLAEMTEQNGWRYVGRGVEKAAEPDPLAEHINAVIDREEAMAMERAHADGIVEGIERARGILWDLDREGVDPDRWREMLEDRIEREKRDVAPADRPPHVDRATLLGLATGWETQADSEADLAVAAPSGSEDRARHNAHDRMLARCADDLRRLLDAPRGPGGGERPEKATAASDSGGGRGTPSTHGGRAPDRVQHDVPAVNAADTSPAAKPENVCPGQWWARRGDDGRLGIELCVDDPAEVDDDLLGDPRWVYLGDGPRPRATGADADQPSSPRADTATICNGSGGIDYSDGSDRACPGCAACSGEPPSDPLEPYRAKASAEQRAACLHPPDDRMPLSGDGWLCGLCGGDCAPPEALAEELTAERLEDVEKQTRAAAERAAKATPGEWAVDASYRRPELTVFACDLSPQPAICKFGIKPEESADAAFIAAARHDVPALAAATLALASELRRLRATSPAVVRELYRVDRSGNGAHLQDAGLDALEQHVAASTPDGRVTVIRHRGMAPEEAASLAVQALGLPPDVDAIEPVDAPFAAPAATCREQLGREVHEAWIGAVSEVPPRRDPATFTRWEDMPESSCEVDRRIGERLFAMGAAHGRAVSERADARLSELARLLDDGALDPARALLEELARDLGEGDSRVIAARWELRMAEGAARQATPDDAALVGAVLTRPELRTAADRDAIEAARAAAESRPPLPVASLVDAVLDVVTDYLDLPDERAPRLRADLLRRLRGELAGVAALPRLYPVTPAVLELADRIEAVVVEAFSGPSDGERRGPACARQVLKAVEEWRSAREHTAAPPKPAAVSLGQRWTCTGVEGVLVVVELAGETGVGLAPVGSVDVCVRVRSSDMLGLREWTFLSSPA